jgi:rod shape-determining protein MreD
MIHRRVLWFRWHQALHVLPLLLLAQAVQLVIAAGPGKSPAGSISAGVVSALLWPVASVLLLAPQRRGGPRREPPHLRAGASSMTEFKNTAQN